MTAALSFEHVTKQYDEGAQQPSLRGLPSRMARVARGKTSTTKLFTALDDVSFDVAEGESLALVGHNGAGKSTALKIATRVVYPSSGCVRLRGRVGALIEVGTGMHPELSGRENIHLYGSIMGLSRADIVRRFEEIVEFSGVSKALDKQLKFYSSGMQLRLGFSVAAYLEPDILLVDEAMAVGDAAFQYKCMQRMTELTAEGRTLIFVSHDMYAVESLCRRVMWIKDGRIVADGESSDVVAQYLTSVERDRLVADAGVGAARGNELDLTSVEVLDEHGRASDTVLSDRSLTVRLHYRAHRRIPSPTFSLMLGDGKNGNFAMATMVTDAAAVPESLVGEGYIDCVLEGLPLQPRTYELWCSVRAADGFSYHLPYQRIRSFQVTAPIEPSRLGGATLALTDAPLRLRHRWESST